MQDRLAVIFGGGGFLGRYVAQNLLARGVRVRIAQRNPSAALFIKPQGGLGQVQFVAADIAKPASVARAVQGADAVINLVGVLKGAFHLVHAVGAGNIAQAAADAGARAMVQVSAIGADVNSPSAYGRSKGEGEAAVRAAFPNATILRPSIVFGREDQFINRFAGLIAMMPVVPIIGGNTKFQPVYVGDVAKAVADAALDPDLYGGDIFALGGPQVLSMRDINQWIAKETGRTPTFVDMPDFAASAMARLTGWAPGAPITMDQWKMLQSDNVVAPDEKGLEAFGITPTPLAAIAPAYLVPFRKHGRFAGRIKT